MIQIDLSLRLQVQIWIKFFCWKKYELNGLLEKERLEKEHDEFWRDFESGYETYKAGNYSRDCDVQFIQTYCQTMQVGYCEKFCEQRSCYLMTDQGTICCSNCDRDCGNDYTYFLIDCSEKADLTMAIAWTVSLFSLPLLALLSYFFCYQKIKHSPCYRKLSSCSLACFRKLSCRKPSFKCCDKNSTIRVYWNRLRESKKQNASSAHRRDDVYDKPYAFDDYAIPYAFEDYEIPHVISSASRAESNHEDDNSIYEIYQTRVFPETSSC